MADTSVKLAVCGGRNERLFPTRKYDLSLQIAELGATEIVTGGCRGIDQDAEDYAMELGLETTTFRPAWNEHGRAAGPLRNKQIAEYADVLVAFPGGAGTEDMVQQMEALGKKVVRLG